MRLRDNPAVLHYVMFAVVFYYFVLRGGREGEGGGRGRGSRVWSYRAEKCNHCMSQGKNLLHTNSVF